MPIFLSDKIKPANNRDFPIADAVDISVDEKDTRLPEVLEALTPIYLTQDEYDALEEAGELLAGREYRILEG